MELLGGLKDFFIVKRRGTMQKQDTTVTTQVSEIKIVKRRGATQKQDTTTVTPQVSEIKIVKRRGATQKQDSTTVTPQVSGIKIVKRKGATQKQNTPPVITKDSETLIKTNMKKKKLTQKPIGAYIDFKKNKHNFLEIIKNTNATPIRGHGDKGYACCFCNTSFMNPTDLKIHTIDEHFETKQKLNYSKGLPDILIKLDITSLQCKICLEYIDSIETLKTHLIAHGIHLHMDIKNYMLPFKFESDELQCAICHQEYGTFSSLLRHTCSHYRNYVCDKCKAGFVTTRTLKNHTMTHDLGVFKCEICDKTYDTVLRLKMHERAVHKSGLSICGYCKQKFNNYWQKKKHLEAVHGLAPKVYQCKACDKTFSTSTINRHIRSAHLMERPHQCPHCDKAFFVFHTLKEHLATHTNEKNYQCDICSQQFTMKRYLRRHMVKHKE